MKIGPTIFGLWLVCGVGAFSTLAQSDEALENRFNLSYRAGFNIKANFRNLGQTPVAGGPSVTGLSYDNGFVRHNSEPNDQGLSWNWGYQNANQVVGDNIVMTSSQRGSLGKASEDAPANGVELSYDRRLGWWGKAPWGLEGAINYTGVDINHGGKSSALHADAFSLGGATPPAAPYSGTPEGPGILINETPTAATAVSRATLETSVLGFRLGPSIDYPFNEKWSVGGSAGFAIAYADTDFHYQDVVTVGGISATQSTGKASGGEWLPGWYIGGEVGYSPCKAGRFFAGVQFQDVGDQTLRAKDKQTRLDLSQSIFLNIGLSYSF